MRSVLRTDEPARRGLEGVLAMGRVLSTTASYEEAVAAMVATVSDVLDVEITKLEERIAPAGSVVRSSCQTNGEVMVTASSIRGPLGSSGRSAARGDQQKQRRQQPAAREGLPQPRRGSLPCVDHVQAS